MSTLLQRTPNIWLFCSIFGLKMYVCGKRRLVIATKSTKYSQANVLHSDFVGIRIEMRRIYTSISYMQIVTSVRRIWWRGDRRQAMNDNDDSRFHDDITRTKARHFSVTHTSIGMRLRSCLYYEYTLRLNMSLVSKFQNVKKPTFE